MLILRRLAGFVFVAAFAGKVWRGREFELVIVDLFRIRNRRRGKWIAVCVLVVELFVGLCLTAGLFSPWANIAAALFAVRVLGEVESLSLRRGLANGAAKRWIGCVGLVEFCERSRVI